MDYVLEVLVPAVGAPSEADGGCEEVAPVFVHFGGLGIEASGAFLGVGYQPLPHGLHALAAVRLTEDHNRKVLHIVKTLHSCRSDVQ